MNFNYKQLPGNVLNKRECLETKPIISIITATYNADLFFYKTAYSILNQTYPNFEWIIVDDGSTNEKSKNIINDIVKLDSRISFYSKKNEGPAIARDYGVSKSSKDSKYVFILDDDDLIDKTYLECAYITLETNQTASFAYADTANFGDQNFLWHKLFDCQKMKSENLLVATALIRKEAYLKVGGYELAGRGLYEDWIFWLKLLEQKMFPVHMSYYGFYYRKINNSGNLAEALEKHKKNMISVNQYASLIKEDVEAIEYPKNDYDYGILNEELNVCKPNYKKNNKINILFIVPWLTLGGADKFNLDLLERIDSTKFHITLITTQPTTYKWRQKFEAVTDEIFDLSTFLDKKNWIAFINYLIISRNISIIFNSNSTSGYAMLPYLKARHEKIKIMDYIHMEEWYNRNGGYSRDAAAINSVIDKTLFCNKNSEKIYNNYFNIPSKKAGTVYIGVDYEKFDPSKYDRELLLNSFNIKNRFVVSMIARIDYQKRPYLLVKIIEEAVKENIIPNILFLIAGDGQLLNNIKLLIKKKNLCNYVMFVGKTDKPDHIYAVSDMTINCSIKEGLALTAYESLSMNVPVLSCDVGGQKELITKKTGVIVPCLQDETEIRNFNYSEEEIKNYVVGLKYIYDNYDSYKKNCRNEIIEKFTLDKMVINMEKQFTKLKRSNCKLGEVDVYKELINFQFLTDKELHNWFCLEYKNELYGTVNNSRFIKTYNKFILKASKIKMHEELGIILKTGYKMAKSFKHCFVNFLKFFYHGFNGFVDLVFHIVKRIFKIGAKND